MILVTFAAAVTAAVAVVLTIEAVVAAAIGSSR